MSVYDKILGGFNQKRKQFALLIDPDDISESDLGKLISKINTVGLDFVFIGGSLLMKKNYERLVSQVKSSVNVPVVLFPGNSMQISEEADAILFLSLISGRNPEYLIGQQVISAPQIKAAGIEPIGTGYVLVDGGRPTSVTYMSNTLPIPRDKDDICVSTALAGEMIGNKLIYLDGGSGAENAVPCSMIRRVSNNISIPLIVGGGLNTQQKIIEACEAGADIVVVGNAVEKDIDLLADLVLGCKKSMNEDCSNL